MVSFFDLFIIILYVFNNIQIVFVAKYLFSRYETQFYPSSFILVSEIIKFLICGLIYMIKYCQINDIFKYKLLRNQFQEFKLFLFPALVSVCSNILIFISIDHLDLLIVLVCFSGNYISYQFLKYFKFNQKLTLWHLIIFITFIASIIFALLNPLTPEYKRNFMKERDPLLGLISVMFGIVLNVANLSYFSSSQVAVITINLNSTKSFIRQQFQLSLYSILSTLFLSIILSSFEERQKFFNGSFLVWWLVLCQSIDSLLNFIIIYRSKVEIKEKLRLFAILPSLGIYCIVCLGELSWPIQVASGLMFVEGIISSLI